MTIAAYVQHGTIVQRTDGRNEWTFRPSDPNDARFFMVRVQTFESYESALTAVNRASENNGQS